LGEADHPKAPDEAEAASQITFKKVLAASAIICDDKAEGIDPRLFTLEKQL
jgi:hypothetical protein